jgi:hypothetical protein
MWEDENDLRRALRSALDGPAPPPPSPGGLDDALRRGRRRAVVQRVGAVAGVLAVVCGIGLGSVALRGVAAGPEVGPADGPAVTGGFPSGVPTAVPAELDLPEGWTPAPLPAQRPHGTWEPANTAPPPAGRVVPPMPMCDAGSPENLHEFAAKVITVDLEQLVLSEIRAGGHVAHEVRTSPPVAGKPAVAKTTYDVDIEAPGGTGGLSVSAGRWSGGDVLRAADAHAFVYGNCAPPLRRWVGDSLLQLYETRPSEPFQTLTRVLRIYTSTGFVHSFELTNRSLADPSGAGRADLPLSTEQFVALGVQIAKWL